MVRFRSSPSGRAIVLPGEENYAGLDVTGKRDSTDALQAFLQPSDRQPPNAFGDTRHTVSLPPGARLRVTRPLEITRKIHIRGNGAQLFCDTTTGLTDLLRIRSTAPETMVDDLALLYAISSVQLIDNPHTAIKVECFNVQLRDLVIDGSGFGVNIDTEGELYNLNCPFLENIWIKNTRRVGLRILGVDCSAGAFIAVRMLVTQNHFDAQNGAGAAIGIFEASANGGTYLACHVEVSNEGIVIQPHGGVAPSTFVGTYVEEGDPLCWRPSGGTSGVDYSGNTTVIGGHMARSQETRNDRFGARSTQANFRQEFTARRSGLPTLTFSNEGPTGDTITRSAGPGGSPAGSFLTDGFRPNMLLSSSGTVFNNFSGALIANVTATQIILGTQALLPEVIANTSAVKLTAVAKAYSLSIPAEDQNSAFTWQAEDSAVTAMLMKFDGSVPGTEKWAVQPFLAQSVDALGVQLVDQGGGNYDVSPVVAASVPQRISGSGSWDGRSSTVWIEGSGARTIAIPNAPKLNAKVLFVDNLGTAQAGNVTLDPAGAGTINGQPTLLLSSNYASAEIAYVGGGNWVRL